MLKKFENFEEHYEETEINTYRVNLIETTHGFIVVEAKDEEDAIDKAMGVYEDGNTNWGNIHVDWDPKKED